MRVKVYAASLNFFDLLQLVGKYQSKVNFPFTPGSEGSGEVVELYEGEGEEGEDGEGKLKVGEKVIFGMSTGTLAREVVISRTMIMPYPRHLSAEEAAALPVGYCTAYHGLIQRAQLKKGEIVFITGAAGGMGLSAIQLSKVTPPSPFPFFFYIYYRYYYYYYYQNILIIRSGKEGDDHSKDQ